MRPFYKRVAPTPFTFTSWIAVQKFTGASTVSHHPMLQQGPRELIAPTFIPSTPISGPPRDKVSISHLKECVYYIEDFYTRTRLPDQDSNLELTINSRSFYQLNYPELYRISTDCQALRGPLHACLGEFHSGTSMDCSNGPLLQCPVEESNLSPSLYRRVQSIQTTNEAWGILSSRT